MERELELVLQHLTLPCADRDELLRRFADSLELVAAGEPGVALENICDNLVDFDVRLERAAFEALVRLCAASGITGKRVERLSGLVAAASTPPFRSGRT